MTPSHLDDNNEGFPNLSIQVIAKDDKSTVLNKYQKTITLCRQLIKGNAEDKLKAFKELETLMDVCICMQQKKAGPETHHIDTINEIVDVASLKSSQVYDDNNNGKIFGFSSDNTVLHSMIKMLHKSYTHCKESEQTYGKHLMQFSVVLKKLFHKSFALQTSCIAIVSKYNVNPAENRGFYLAFIQRVYEITKITEKLDATVSASSWKLLLNIVKKSNYFDGSKRYIMDLIERGSYNFKSLMDACMTATSANKSTLSHCKLASFYTTQITFLIRKANIDENLHLECRKFVFKAGNCLLNICKHFRHGKKEAHIFENKSFEPVQNQILGEVLLSYDRLLLTASIELKLLDIQSLDLLTDFGEAEDACGSTLLKMFIMLRIIRSFKLLTEEHSSLIFDWIAEKENNQSVFQFFFKLLPQIRCDLLLGMSLYGFDEVQPDGGAVTADFLFEKIVSHLSCCVVNLPARHFHQLEMLLLQQVVNEQQTFCRVLAIDLWSFLARLSTPELCYNHALSVVRIMLASKTHRRVKLSSLLRRLFAFLPHEFQQRLVSEWSQDGAHEFPTLTFVQFVGVQAVSFFSQDAVKEELSRLIASVSSQASDWFEKGNDNCKLTHLLDSLQQVYVVHEQLCTEKNSAIFNQMGCTTEMFRSLRKLCNEKLLEMEICGNSNTCKLAGTLLFLMSSFLKTKLSQTTDVGEDVKKVIGKLFDNTSKLKTTSRFLLRSVVGYLGSLCFVNLDPESQGMVVSIWMCCFETCRSDWLLRYQVIDKLESFSRVTSNPQVITRIYQSPPIGSCIREHLKRVPVAAPSNIREILQEHLVEMASYPQVKLQPHDSHRDVNVGEIITSLIRMTENVSPRQLSSSTMEELKNTIEKVGLWLKHS